MVNERKDNNQSFGPLLKGFVILYSRLIKVMFFRKGFIDG
jgi:hypothetical protein